MVDTQPPTLNRREFLKLASLLGGAVLYAGCRQRPDAPSPTTEPQTLFDSPDKLLPAETTDRPIGEFEFGKEEFVDTANLQWVPDARTSFLFDQNGVRMFVSAGTDGFVLSGKEIGSLASPRKFLEPTREKSDIGYNGYRAPGSVMRGRTSQELLCFYHEEHWQSEQNGFPFTARVGLAVSPDNGKNWTTIGSVVKGSNEQKADGKRVSGAGQPSALLVKEGEQDWVYLYHTDWDSPPDSIHLAKARLSEVDKPAAWEKVSGAVITPPEGEVYAALPCVSWNEKLGKYLAIFESDSGFWAATSTDATKWGDYQKLLNFPSRLTSRQNGDIWYSYPTSVSPETNDQNKTTDTGYLYFSKGLWNTEPHKMYRKSFKIT